MTADNIGNQLLLRRNFFLLNDFGKKSSCETTEKRVILSVFSVDLLFITFLTIIKI